MEGPEFSAGTDFPNNANPRTKYPANPPEPGAGWRESWAS